MALNRGFLLCLAFCSVAISRNAPVNMQASSPTLKTTAEPIKQTIPIQYRMNCGAFKTCDRRSEYCNSVVPKYETCKKCSGICDLKTSIFTECQQECKGYLDYNRSRRTEAQYKTVLDKFSLLRADIESAWFYNYLLLFVLAVVGVIVLLNAVVSVFSCRALRNIHEHERIKQPVDTASDGKSIESGIGNTQCNTPEIGRHGIVAPIILTSNAEQEPLVNQPVVTV